MKIFLHKTYTLLERNPAAFLIALALFFNCFIELSSRQSAISLLSFILLRPHMFLINTAVILCTYSIAFFVKRRAFTVVAVSALWLVLCMVNIILMAYRATPFIVFDLTLAADGLRIAGAYFAKPIIALFAVVLLAGIIGIIIAFKKLPRCAALPIWKRIVCAVIPIAVLLIPAVGAAAEFDVSAESDNLLQAYDEFGFAYCFASGLLSSGIGRPEMYSEDAVAEILSQLGNNKPAPKKTPNVVFVQLESFFDPRLLDNYPKNTVPVFAKLKENYPSGFLHVPSFGGGTANTEFEVLTGMTLNHFGVGEYPYESVLTERACESIAYNLKNNGYAAHALHNHSGTFYSRNTVYSSLGFDSFIPLEYMKNPEYTPTGWAEDEVLTDYIIDSLQRTEEPDFIFTVTVQCHGKYPDDFTGTAAGIAAHEDFSFLSPGAFNYFTTQLGRTDAFIGELLEKLEKLPEDTVLVLYGDHLPPLPIPPEKLKSDSLYTTEYVIWSNFEIDADDKDLNAFELSAYVLDLLDMNAGVITKIHQSYSDVTDRDDALRMMSYDMLYGESYAGSYTPSELDVGYGDIKIAGVYTDGDYSYVRGCNFTRFSVIYTDGKRRDTEFISDELLRTTYAFEDGDAVSVCQSGADKEILGTTREFLIFSYSRLMAMPRSPVRLLRMLGC